jgi:hypothetical protein
MIEHLSPWSSSLALSVQICDPEHESIHLSILGFILDLYWEPQTTELSLIPTPALDVADKHA